ncbi:MAG: hypothetical protein IJ916_10030 [Paludibacteraceae bacterium]|nr:hypothetical protein [Paludibacteraceae bacterium]
MGYKIAVATSDGLNIDLHFGSAPQFEIYSVEGLDFHKIETRSVPVSQEQQYSYARNVESGCGNGLGPGDGSGCNSGCNSGCGSRNGCGGGERSESVELLSDCRSVVCKKIGRNILKQFERKAISVFDIELPIKEALSKIVSYYYKIDERKIR